MRALAAGSTSIRFSTNERSELISRRRSGSTATDVISSNGLHSGDCASHPSLPGVSIDTMPSTSSPPPPLAATACSACAVAAFEVRPCRSSTTRHRATASRFCRRCSAIDAERHAPHETTPSSAPMPSETAHAVVSTPRSQPLSQSVRRASCSWEPIGKWRHAPHVECPFSSTSWPRSGPVSEPLECSARLSCACVCRTASSYAAPLDGSPPRLAQSLFSSCTRSRLTSGSSTPPETSESSAGCRIRYVGRVTYTHRLRGTPGEPSTSIERKMSLEEPRSP